MVKEEEDGDGDEESTNDGDEESVNDQDEPGDSQDEHGDAPLEIDEIRNGMLLSKIIHAFLSKCIGFLRVRMLSHILRCSLVDGTVCYRRRTSLWTLPTSILQPRTPESKRCSLRRSMQVV